MKIPRKVALLRHMETQIYEIRRSLTSEYSRLLGPRGTTLHEVSVLDLVRRFPNMSQQAIVNRLNLDPATVSRVVNRLRENGYVEVDVDPDDRRGRLVRATPIGENFHCVVSGDLVMHIESQFSDVTAQQLEAAIIALERLASTLGVEVPPMDETLGE